jgi:hypothetical protein
VLMMHQKRGGTSQRKQAVPTPSPLQCKSSVVQLQALTNLGGKIMRELCASYAGNSRNENEKAQTDRAVCAC